MRTIAIAIASFSVCSGLFDVIRRRVFGSIASANAAVSGLHAIAMIIVSFVVLSSSRHTPETSRDVTPSSIVDYCERRRTGMTALVFSSDRCTFRFAGLLCLRFPFVFGDGYGKEEVQCNDTSTSPSRHCWHNERCLCETRSFSVMMYVTPANDALGWERSADKHLPCRNLDAISSSTNTSKGRICLYGAVRMC